MNEFIQVVTTCGSKDEARLIARRLLDSHQAACVQVLGPVESTYWWEGKIDTSEEWYAVIKTRADLFPSVQETVLAD